MPTKKSASLEIVLGAKNLTAGPFNRVIASLQRLKAAGTQAVGAVTARIKTLAASLAAFAGPAAILGSIRIGAQFEEDLAKVGTLGAEAREMLEEFRFELEKIAVSTGTPLDDLTEALFNMISAGVPAATAIKTLGEANRLAVAGSASLAQSTFALTKVLSAYSLSADEARQVAEKLFATQVIGQTTLQEVANNFAKVTSVAASLNVPLDQLAAAFGDITKSSANTEEAAVSLRQSLVVLQKPTSDLQNIMETLDITLDNLFDDGRTLGDVWAAITKEARRLDKNMATVTGNIRAFTAVAALGAKDGLRYATALSSFRKATEELDVSFDLLNSTTASTINQLKEFIKIISARFAAPFMKELNEQVKITTSELIQASINAEIFGLQLLKWADQLSPAIELLKLAFNLIMIPITAAANGLKVLFKLLELFMSRSKELGRVFKNLGYLINQAFRDINDAGGALVTALIQSAKSLAQGFFGLLLEPVQWLLFAIKETIKAVAVLGFEIANIFSDAELPKDFGEIAFLEDAYDKLIKYQEGLLGSTEQAKQSWTEFVDISSRGLGNLSDSWGGLTNAAKSYGNALLRDDEVTRSLYASADMFISDMGAGFLSLNRSLIDYAESIERWKSGLLGKEQTEEIKELRKELSILKKTTKDLSQSTNPLWEQMVISAEAYSNAVKNGFDATLAFNTLVLKVPKPDTSAIDAAGEDVKQKAIAIWDTLKIYGQGLSNLYGQAKANEIKLAWQSVGEMFTALFKKKTIENKMDQWAMSIEDLGTSFIRVQQGSLARFFDSVAAGTARSQDLWKNMLQGMLSALNQFLADRLVLQFLAGFGFGPLAGGDVNVGTETAAKGAIWQGGFTPFKQYANGGIVTKPTLGLIGEAGQNEAIVPLPDGKSIPVEMNSSGGSDTFNINIQALDGASIQKLLLSDSGQRAIVSAFRNARATRRGFQ